MLRSSLHKAPEFTGDDVELHDRGASALLPQHPNTRDTAASCAEDQTAPTPVNHDIVPGSTPPAFESFKMPAGEELTPEELL